MAEESSDRAGGIGAAFTGPRFASGFHTFRVDYVRVTTLCRQVPRWQHRDT